MDNLGLTFITAVFYDGSKNIKKYFIVS